MSKKTSFSLSLGTAFAVAALSAPLAAHSESVFKSQSLSQGYQLAENDAKTPEGKCGADKMKDGKCGAATKTDKKMEGKCGEGKCGASKKKTHEAKCGADKMKDGKCGADKK